MRHRICAALSGAVLMISGVTPVAVADDWWDRDGCDWTQWGQSAAHTGQSCVRGQRDLRLLTRLVVDPFAAQLAAEAEGAIPVRYPAPLVDGDGNVFILKKGGTFVSCDPPGSEQPAPCGKHPESLNLMTWSVQALRWQHNRLVPKWTFTTDWKPTQTGVETLVQSAMSRDHLYVPGAGGTVFQLAKGNGRVVKRINPFGHTLDPQTFVAGGLTVDAHGTLFYNVIKLEPAPTGGSDAHSWLVRATRDRTSTVDYRTLIPDAPRPTDLCHTTFQAAGAQRPFPPPPQPDGSPTLPPQQACGSQRAGLNMSPAIGPDGTVFTVTRAHSNPGGDNYGHLVALHPDLRLKWATSLRGHLDDGCGVLTPYGTGVFDCRPGATRGVDPLTNLPPAAGVFDFSSASPVVLPDGSVLYGSRTPYNGFRGHLMKFDHRGRYLANYDFGWDITPAVQRHHRGYTVFIKDNHYSSNGPFHLTRLDANLNKQWSHKNTETRTCERGPDDAVSCVDDGQHPNGFEWSISSPAVDRDGNLYSLSADGNLYIIDDHGNQRQKVFLSKTIGALDGPLSLDSHGRVYAQNNGELYVLGR